MKNLRIIFRLFLLTSLVILFTQCKKEKDFNSYVYDQKIHRINLTCDTIPINKNFNQVCNFGQKQGNNEDYTIEATLWDVVVWEGKLTNPKDGKIRINNIIYESGTNIFNNKNIHDKDDRKEDGQIIATIKKGKAKQELKYKLRFTVLNSENKPVITDTIDPKIRMIKPTVSAYLGEDARDDNQN